MHELSIVNNIIGIVGTEAKKSGAKRVSEVHLEIGKLAGVEFDSLDFALKALAPGSAIAEAEIIIKKTEGTACCNICRNRFLTDNFTGNCNSCGSTDLEITGGRELRVHSITIE